VADEKDNPVLSLLVVNDQPWGPYIQSAPDLSSVLPSGTPFTFLAIGGPGYPGELVACRLPAN
jgi:hypothetical protein